MNSDPARNLAACLTEAPNLDRWTCHLKIASQRHDRLQMLNGDPARPCQAGQCCPILAQASQRLSRCGRPGITVSNYFRQDYQWLIAPQTTENVSDASRAQERRTLARKVET